MEYVLDPLMSPNLNLNNAVNSTVPSNAVALLKLHMHFAIKEVNVCKLAMEDYSKQQPYKTHSV